MVISAPEFPTTAVAPPRVKVTAHGGRAGRTEALDVPADPDGIAYLVAWLAEHVGWEITHAEVTP